jgi:LysR family transcriptional regulator, transcriptional activator of the cysJI operon
MVLVVPTNHEWADQEVDIEALKQQPLLMREVGSGSRRVIETAIVTAGLRKKDLSPTPSPISHLTR